MADINLLDDLLHEYKEQRKMVYEQLNVLDPMATSLRKPAAQRLISNGLLIMLEICCYLLFLGGIALMVFMNKIYPFYILSDMTYNSHIRSEIGIVNTTYLNLSVYGLCTIISILFLIIARNVRTIRLKNQILHTAGKNIKLVVADYLKRKAAIEVIEQRHFSELPLREDGSYITSKNRGNITEVPNPGYDEAI